MLVKCTNTEVGTANWRKEIEVRDKGKTCWDGKQNSFSKTDVNKHLYWLVMSFYSDTMVIDNEGHYDSLYIYILLLSGIRMLAITVV